MERPHFDIVASGARMRAIRQERKISVKQSWNTWDLNPRRPCINGKPESAFPRPTFDCFSYFVSCKPDGAFGRRGPGALF